MESEGGRAGLFSFCREVYFLRVVFANRCRIGGYGFFHFPLVLDLPTGSEERAGDFAFLFMRGSSGQVSKC